MGNPLKLIAWLVLPIVGLVLVGAIAWWALGALFHVVGYLVLGAVVVGGGALVYRKVRRSIGPGTRTRRRIEAAAETYRMRKND
ncbi:MAG: hypothetical protein J2P15_13220 [Micromonosporaceae bacterium]|nr:hypothetical protein [Micromonosporaceae bacterium]